MSTSVRYSDISLNVYQKQWGFSKSIPIKTGSFGPCYVVVLTGRNCAAMAHIDDMTQVETIERIFDRFRAEGIPQDCIDVSIRGGWINHLESRKWGDHIWRKIVEANCKSLDVEYIFSKKTPPPQLFITKVSRQETAKYYYFGVSVDPQTGKIVLNDAPDDAIEDEQFRQMEKLFSDPGYSDSTLYPLTEVINKQDAEDEKDRNFFESNFAVCSIL